MISAMSSRTVAELVAAHLDGWELRSTEEAVFGTRDPRAIESLLAEFCTNQLGSGIAHGLFYSSSVGCVAGVELGDGRRVVIKAYQGRWGVPFLAAVCRVQSHLAARGFPCPEAVAGGDPVGRALANVEVFRPDPGAGLLGSSETMAASAAGLAWQIRLCRELAEPALDQHPLAAIRGRLYPEPHSPVFDFAAKAEEATWIDDLAGRAKAIRDAVWGPPTIAHTDWSARNVRIRDGRLVLAYDWDSLALVSEPVAVGQAAATWRSLGDSGDPAAPDPEETVAYVSAYETAAGYRLTSEQRKAALAAALWVLCYTARCEHSIEVTTGRKVERARARLAADGSSFLGLAAQSSTPERSDASRPRHVSPGRGTQPTGGAPRRSRRCSS